MGWLSWTIVILLAAFIVYTKIKEQKQVRESTPQEIPVATAQDYSKSYQKKYLLTRNEWHEYKKLQQYADIANLQICPKVRLLDIIEPRKGESNYMALLGKVQSKHVDFLICDKDLHVLGVIELDDNSHDQQNRKDRDAFVDQILQSVGYKVVHTRGVTETTLDIFTKKTPEE